MCKKAVVQQGQRTPDNDAAPTFQNSAKTTRSHETSDLFGQITVLCRITSDETEPTSSPFQPGYALKNGPESHSSPGSKSLKESMMNFANKSDVMGTTIISVIAGIAKTEELIRKRQLERFIQQYGAPLKSHIEFRAHVDQSTAEDILHDFLVDKLLADDAEKNLACRFLKKHEQVAVKFRSYLLRSLNNYLVDRARSPRINTMSLQENFGDGAAAQSESGADRFAIEWAQNLIQKTIDAVYEECLTDDQEHIWEVLNQRILHPALTGEAAPSYAQLVEQLGFNSAKEASNRLQTSIRKFNRILRNLIRDYLPIEDEEELEQAIDSEIDDLRSVLRSARAFSFNSRQKADSPPGSFVASLFRLREDQAMDDDQGDYERVWQDLLETRFDSLLSLDLSRANTSSKRSGATQPLYFQDLLQQPAPQLEILKLIKQQAKLSALRPHDPDSQLDSLPYQINVLLYTLAIAIADIRHGVRITRDDNSKIAPRLATILASSWIDPATRRILSEWSIRITQ